MEKNYRYEAAKALPKFLRFNRPKRNPCNKLIKISLSRISYKNDYLSAEANENHTHRN